VADVNPKNVEFIIILLWQIERALKANALKFQSTNKKGQRKLVSDIVMKEIYNVCPDDIERLGLEDYHLLKAISFGINIQIVDLDITTDFRGTLNATQIRQNMEECGIPESNNSQAGKNCVSRETFDIENGVTMRAKVYDKIIESVEQDSVSNTIGDKTGLILNPSMPGLRRDFIKHQDVGLTRSVSTCVCVC
jgi:hypothetical protein